VAGFLSLQPQAGPVGEDEIMTIRWCEIEKRGHGRCGAEAVSAVAYYQDGGGRKFACGMHVAKAMEQVAADAHLYGTETLYVRPLGALTARIEKARRPA
jgi:hypothetical protein